MVLRLVVVIVSMCHPNLIARSNPAMPLPDAKQGAAKVARTLAQEIFVQLGHFHDSEKVDGC